MDRQKKYWYALYTKPRHEFKARKDLQAAGLEYYMPTVTTLKQWSDRKKKVTEPLFRGYVFLYGDEAERYAALQSPAILSTVNWNGVPAKIPDWEIENLRIFLSEKHEVFVGDKIEKGTKVKIAEGPFSGVEGIVFDNSRNERMLAISIDFLNRSVLVRLPAQSVVKTKEKETADA
ncbi:MAG: UpxY family transcription antiterminator [Chlorobi bacterium]|nr:UpxY family transcription antiterminator [Chlorobiota bacterium]